MNNKGDLSLRFDLDGDLDINFVNGQPIMTDYFDNLVILYLFCVDSYYNKLVDNENHRLLSTFPELVNRNVITNSLIPEGISRIKEALLPLKKENVVSSISVEGGLKNLYSVYWIIYLERPIDENVKYSVIWDNEKINFKRYL